MILIMKLLMLKTTMLFGHFEIGMKIVDSGTLFRVEEANGWDVPLRGVTDE